MLHIVPCAYKCVDHADMGDLSIDDIGQLRLHEEGKLMNFDIIVVPQGGIYKCAHLHCER